jgi:hypothetical protein
MNIIKKQKKLKIEWRMVIMNEETVKIKLYFKDGRTINTMFRGSYKEAIKHWLGNTFNLNYGTVDIQECVQISKLN